MNLCPYLYQYLYLSLYLSIHPYTYTYTCMQARTHTHTHTRTQPDTFELLRVLYYQLKSAKLPESVEKERDAAQELTEAARGVKVLLVLDDCWDEKHAKLLNCVDPAAGSACVITTRIRNLGDGEISCGLLSTTSSSRPSCPRAWRRSAMLRRS